MSVELLEHLTSSVTSAGTTGELRKLRETFLSTRPKPPAAHVQDWNTAFNAFYDGLIRRSIELSEQLLRDGGMGPPPVSYSFVLFGSGGRSEQTLFSDQDNGLIFENDGQASTAAYFAELGQTISQSLVAVGFPPCDGQVIVTNGMWNKTINEWEAMLQSWCDEPSWEHIRYLLIVADMRCVYGDAEFTRRLQSRYAHAVTAKPELLDHMLQNTLHHKITLGLFGQLIRERYGEESGGFDIKYGGYIPMVNGIRLLSIQVGITEPSTWNRIEALAGTHGSRLAADWESAFETLLRLRLLAACEVKEDGAFHGSAFIKEEELTGSVRRELKLALQVGRELQKYVRKQT